MGRKALIVITGGTDHGSTTTLGHAIEQAQRADTCVYSMSFGGGFVYLDGGPGREGFDVRKQRGLPAPDSKEILPRLSRETGGGYFEVPKTSSIDQICGRVDEELRNQYRLSYVPDKPDRGFHKVDLTVKGKSLTVQTRAAISFADSSSVAPVVP